VSIDSADPRNLLPAAGISGVSENIRVLQCRRSLPGTRPHLLLFTLAADVKCIFSSQIGMPRNFIRRVEVMFPVDDEIAARSLDRRDLGHQPGGTT